MKIRNPRSIIVILIYVALNGFILMSSFNVLQSEDTQAMKKKKVRPDPTVIENFDYFSLKNGMPQMSMNGKKMTAMGENQANFKKPRGVYISQENSETIRYQGLSGSYNKRSSLIAISGKAHFTSTDGEYFSDHAEYFMDRDLIVGTGNVHFIGEDLKSRDELNIRSARMNAYPKQKVAHFYDNVNGTMTRKKKYEGKMEFKSNVLHMYHAKSLAELVGDVWMRKGTQQVTSGKADIYLENFNKSLKYFVLNDDVKVTEKLSTPSGITERRAFAERLEGFGREQKMVLSGAPRVEQGTDVVKGYRITIRENVDLIEVDDAMSDMKVKRDEKKKPEETQTKGIVK